MSASMKLQRRFPIGAEVRPDGVSFRVWAPKANDVTIKFEARESGEAPSSYNMQAEADGYFSATVAGARAGDRYRFELNGQQHPDPASRFQPDGPHGCSQVVDHCQFQWTDSDWKGIKVHGQILYEMHIGTFTPEGTYAAAERQLEELKRIGITTLEVMPVADFVGDYGWGYDGVSLFAPTRLYGKPDELRSFINAAHKLGLAVILDVVYNHFGADGNYIGMYSQAYFSKKYDNEWGDALNFDGEDSASVREFFLTNAAYWIDEFHFDGLRLDATQQIFDSSSSNIMKEICDEVRKHAKGRNTYIVGENETQDVKLIRSVDEGGYGMDGLWNDDFHHSARVALTGKNEYYFADYLGEPSEFIAAIKYGYLFQGQYSVCKNASRGTPSLDIDPIHFVNFIQNHDQIANSGRGQRINELTTPGLYRAMTALLLLSPQTPMLFQGQEFASSAPFIYFADHQPELAAAVDEGRKKAMAQFRSMNNKPALDKLPLPHERSSFERCKLDFSEREKNAELYRMTMELINLRKSDFTFSNATRGTVDGAVLNETAFVLRWLSNEPEGERLMFVNLGRDFEVRPGPQPLLSAPRDCNWTQILSTEEPKFNGIGAPAAYDHGLFYLPAHCAVVLAAEKFKP